MPSGTPLLTVRHFDAGTCNHADASMLTGSDSPSSGWFWLDLSCPTHDEAAVLEQIGLHPLIIEDMRDDRHLPKVDVVDDQLNLTVHGLRIGRRDSMQPHDVDSKVRPAQLQTNELDIALVGRFLVTYHETDMPALWAVGQHIDRGGAAEVGRPVLLVHRILDTLNDVMVPIIDYFEERMDVVEEDLLTEPTEATRDDLFRLQRDVIQLRRVVVPQAEVLRRLERDATTIMSEWFDPNDLALLRDVHDHLYRIAGMSESYQQLIDSAMSSYRAAQDDELNDMLRVLTLVSTVLLPISVIAGIWGTNFVDLPGLRQSWGFTAMMVSFLVIIVGMMVWFRARGWLGGAADRAAEGRRASMGSSLDVPVLGTVLRVPLSGARAVERGARSITRRHDSQTPPDTPRERPEP